MTSISLSRRAILAASTMLLSAPALIGRVLAAASLKIATSFPNDPQFSTGRIWYDAFVPRLKEATDGQVTTLFYPDNQLGQEADLVNQLKLGVVDAMLVGTPIWTNLVPEFGVFDLGYLFQDYDHVLRAAATPAASALQKLLVQKAGAHFPTWGRPPRRWLSARCIPACKPVSSMASSTTHPRSYPPSSTKRRRTSL
jgi:TRAP-type transport system periplasmic protein